MSPTAVMNEAFRQSFPPQHDLPPAMNALLAKLSAVEPKTTALAAGEIAAEKDRSLREPLMA
jgi:hypothetical protein